MAKKAEPEKREEKPVNKLIVLEGEQGSLMAFARELTTIAQVRGDNRRLSVVIDPETLEVSEKEDE